MMQQLMASRVLLGEGCDVSVVNEKGQTPLHLSSTKGHVDVVRELITRGCPVDITFYV
jgi:ankyrin repeat protein